MAFWSGAKLRERLPAIVDPFSDDCIDCAAYTLSIGDQVYVSPTEDLTDPKSLTIQQLSPAQPFIIPAGQFAFLLTAESVNVPPAVLGFISIRSRLKFRGLINVSGFHVDPGYHGRLLFAVQNAGPSTIHLRQGDPCFLIWFADLDRSSDDVKKIAGVAAIDSELVSNLAREFKTVQGLSSHVDDVEKKLDIRLHALEKEQQTVRAVLAIAVALVLGVVGSHWFPAMSAGTSGQPQATPRALPATPTALPTPRPSAVQPSPRRT